MKEYKIELLRNEYYIQNVIVIAENEDEAIDKAWDMSGKWIMVDSKEYVEIAEEINHDEDCGK